MSGPVFGWAAKAALKIGHQRLQIHVRSKKSHARTVRGYIGQAQPALSGDSRPQDNLVPRTGHRFDLLVVLFIDRWTGDVNICYSRFSLREVSPDS